MARYKPEWHLQSHFSASHGSTGRRILFWKKTIECGNIVFYRFWTSAQTKGTYKFWSDLVRAHHARGTLQCLKGEGIPFLKEINPSKYSSNPAHIRHMDHCQAAGLHRGLDNYLWTAADQWYVHTNSTIRSLDTEVPRRMMRDFPQRVRRTDQRNILSAVMLLKSCTMFLILSGF